MISVLTYDIPFFSHMTSYDVCCKMFNFGQINTKFGTVVSSIGSHESKLCRDWGHNVDVMVVLWLNYE